MPKPSISSNEEARIVALHHLEILDTQPEATFDQLTMLAAQLCEAPYAALALVDRDRVWFKSQVGFNISETPREMAFCAQTILQDTPMIVPDTLSDERFADNPAVLPPFCVRFYTGVPLKTQQGHSLGSFCVFDRTPRELKQSQIAALVTLARHASAQLEERRVLRELLRADGQTTTPQDLAQQLEGALLGRDQAEIALRSVEKELDATKTQEMIGRLASGIAHDVNNLLAIIQGNAELLSSRLEANNPHQSNVKAIVSAAQKGGVLTQQILAMGKRQIQRPDNLDLNESISEFVELLRNLHRESVDIKFNADPDLKLVHLDLSQLGQIIVNLGINGLDAMPEGGELTISLCNWNGTDPKLNKLEGEFVKLSVKDNGCGMDEQTRIRALDPFFTTKASGTGLGLSTVKGIVDQCEGLVQIDSSPGNGTTIEVYFPCATSEIENGPTTPQKPEERVEQYTVLVVEDENAIRQLITGYLQSAGYRVLSAEHGEAALAIAAEPDTSLDLLITDVDLPGMSGGEVARRMRTNNEELAVLFISGASNDPQVSEEVTNRRSGFLQKPFSMKELGHVIDQELRSSGVLVEPVPGLIQNPKGI